MNLRFSTSQILTSLSSEEETSIDPSWLNSIDLTGAECPFRTVHYALALLFQILTVLSLDTEAINVPRGFTATSVTGPVWPMNLFGLALGRNPQAKISPSLDAEITCFKLGMKMHLVTLSLCPYKALSKVGSTVELESIAMRSGFFMIEFKFKIIPQNMIALKI